MVTHQDLLSQYKSETGKYPTKDGFSKWVEEKYLKMINPIIDYNTPISIALNKNTIAIKQEPITADMFWGLECTGIKDGKEG